MSRRPARALIEDIIEAIGKIDRYLVGLGEEEFLADTKTIDAVIRNLEIIGAATNRLPKSVTGEHPDVPWAQIVGLRNRIIHDYFGVDLELVWTIIKDDLPPFRDSIRKILLNL